MDTDQPVNHGLITKERKISALEISLIQSAKKSFLVFTPHFAAQAVSRIVRSWP
jgi:hypothetical protein